MVLFGKVFKLESKFDWTGWYITDEAGYKVFQLVSLMRIPAKDTESDDAQIVRLIIGPWNAALGWVSLHPAQ